MVLSRFMKESGVCDRWHWAAARQREALCRRPREQGPLVRHPQSPAGGVPKEEHGTQTLSAPSPPLCPNIISPHNVQLP